MKWLTVYFCILCCCLSAQTAYKRVDNIPVTQNGTFLQNPWAGGLNHPLFSEIDLNGDGIKDLFSFEVANSRIACFINKGIPDSIDYIYESSYAAKFPFFQSWVFLRDYNCDG